MTLLLSPSNPSSPRIMAVGWAKAPLKQAQGRPPARPAPGLRTPVGTLRREPVEERRMNDKRNLAPACEAEGGAKPMVGFPPVGSTRPIVPARGTALTSAATPEPPS